MSAIPEAGFLVIADLSGYTAYLSRSELEHAPAIAGDLLETIVGRLDPPFRLGKFEGDAAFLYVEDGRADGSLLLDAVEASYLAFRRRLRSIDQATSCDCNSCQLAPQLDLKLFVHHGAYVRGSIAGRDELAGPDVIIVHRLLKGVAAAEARATGFALLTDDAVKALGIDPLGLGLVPGEESIEHLGRVSTYVLDLGSKWQADAGRRQLDLDEGSVVVDVEATFPAEPGILWAHLTSPSLRTLWEGPLVIEAPSAGGRRGVGTTAQCVTGRLATLEEIVDWQPYDYVGWRLVVPGVGPVAVQVDLESDEAGARTRVRTRWLYEGDGLPPTAGVGGLQAEREAAYERLGRVIAGMPAIQRKEVLHEQV